MGADRHLAEASCVCFFLIKPHAVNAKVEALVRKVFAKNGVTILAEGNKSAVQIKEENIMDRHYGTLANRAVKVSPKDLPQVSNSAEEKCRNCFGRSWTELLASGAVYNLREAEPKLCGDWGSKDIEKEWRSGEYVKLFPGTYVAAMSAAVPQKEKIYVVNGFYASMKDMFENPVSAPNGVHWKVLQWDPNKLTWAEFRDKVIGPTKVDDAPEDSLKGILRDRYRELGLDKKPYGAENGFHASASPLESFRERLIWLKGSLPQAEYESLEEKAKDPVAQQLINSHSVEKYCGNPVVTINGIQTAVFDAVEHKNPLECLEILTKMEDD